MSKDNQRRIPLYFSEAYLSHIEHAAHERVEQENFLSPVSSLCQLGLGLIHLTHEEEKRSHRLFFVPSDGGPWEVIVLARRDTLPDQKNEAEPGEQKIFVALSESSYAGLARMASERNLTPPEVCYAGFSLAVMTHKKEKTGYKLFVGTSKGKLLQEIVLPSGPISLDRMNEVVLDQLIKAFGIDGSDLLRSIADLDPERNRDNPPRRSSSGPEPRPSA